MKFYSPNDKNVDFKSALVPKIPGTSLKFTPVPFSFRFIISKQKFMAT